MRAAVLEEFGDRLTLRDVPTPEPAFGEVLVRTRAAGICRTDLKVIGGSIPTVKPPVIPGHEVAGEVVRLGPGVTDATEGDRVAVSLDLTCGVCGYCRAERANYCSNLRRLGLEEDGGLAEFVRVPAENIVLVPDAVPLDQAATIPDAIGSPYHALIDRAEVRPAHVVAVYGLGGLGLMAIQIGALAGAEVIGIARTPERRDLARQLGAASTVDPNDGAVSDQLLELTRGMGVHSFIDIVGIEDSVEQGIRSCRKGGRVVVVGYFVPRFSGTMMDLVYREVSVMGSRGSTREELMEVVSLVARGRLRPVIGKRIALDDIHEGLASLRAGSVIGRTVVEFEGEGSEPPRG